MAMNTGFQLAKIGLNIDKGKVDPKAQPADFKIETNNPAIEINKSLPKVRIDQSEALNEIGLKSSRALVEDIANNSTSKGVEAIERKSNVGDMLMSIESNPDFIPRAVEIEAWPDDRKETNVGAIPKTIPSVDAQGNLDINHNQGGVNNQTKPGNFSLDFRRAKVSVYLRQKGGALTAGSKVNIQL